MDQLKLVLEYKFWILAGLALLLPPIGWWAATDDLAKETDSRTKKITAAEKRVPDPKDVPNEKWIQGEKEIGRELTESVTQSQERLFDHQKSAMTLPPFVQDALARGNVKYRKDGGASKDFLDAKEFFVLKYLDDWKSALDLIKPFKLTTGEGLVLLPSDDLATDQPPITRHMEVEQWRQSLGFTAEQMWDVQEDVWFLRALMEAVARVNEGTTEIGNARIKKLDEATLRGGNEADLATRLSGKSSGPTNTNALTAPVAAPTAFRAYGRTGGSGNATYKPPKAFDPDDVFGDDGSKANMIADTRAGTGKKGEAAAGEVRRWVDTKANYRKRGFVLRLVMDEREIPTLLTSLSQSPFPVEIRHVEHSVHNSSSGTDVSRVAAAAAVANPDSTVEITREQQALQHKISENLRMAFNMHYLVNVIVAGTLTIYDPPKTTASSAVQAGANRTSVGATPAGGAALKGKTALPGAGSAKSIAVPSKSVSTPSGTATGGTGSQPTKAGSPALPPPNANKTISPTRGLRPAGK